MEKTYSWNTILHKEKKQPYFIDILNILAKERRTTIIYPPKQDVFNAFRFTRFEDIKVVILGQDPYYGPGQAHGLAFSVRHGIAIPPSLLNIYRELENSISGFVRPSHGYLENWARQGVMLLNTILTVRANQARSHSNLGWQIFTHHVIQSINQYRKEVVFLLWGVDAQKTGEMINVKRHYVLKASHPSPFSASRGFFGCNHFYLTNQWLKTHGYEPIDWSL